ncbi:MAG: YtfJ family protein [Bacteroidetes bacterium]|nr:YtfJ family protein [Bacteroidota bacterium]
MKSLLISFLLLCLPVLTSAQVAVGVVLPKVDLSGDNGGRLNGQLWSSSEITGKVYTMMYVDPDEKGINEHVEQALKAENFPRDKYGSIAMINMDASWKPNAVIKMVIDGKQKDFPHTIYVMDKDKILVKKWGLADDNYHVITFDKTGKVIFQKAGKLTDSDVKKLIEAIKTNL